MTMVVMMDPLGDSQGRTKHSNIILHVRVGKGDAWGGMREEIIGSN